MKTIGIIGGLGPETTSEFYLEIIFLCQQKDKTNRPPVLIWSVPIPYKVEEEAIAKAENIEKCLPLLIEAAQKLEKSGADFLVMPCNSLHTFIKEIRNTVKIPVLSIIEETTKFLKGKGISKVGILATAITLDKKIYKKSFNANDIEQVNPNGFQQAKIGKMIHNLVSNRHSNKDREELIKIVNDFENKGINHVILACTDLQLLIPQHPKLKIYDTMKIFAEATVQKILRD
jgi:aspartate racemase